MERKSTVMDDVAKRGSLLALITSRGGIIATLVSVAALGVTAATTLGVTSFSAEVGGTGSFQSGTLLLSDTNGSGTCLSSANSSGSITTNINTSCAGSDLGSGTTNKPGGTAQVSDVTLTNQGSINSTGGLALVTGACTATGAPYASSVLNPLTSGSDTAGFCGEVDVTVYNSTAGNCVFPAQSGACPSPSNANGTLATMASNSTTLAATLAAGASVALVVTTQLDNAGTAHSTGADNADQGLVANMTMTYTLYQ